MQNPECSDCPFNPYRIDNWGKHLKNLKFFDDIKNQV